MGNKQLTYKSMLSSKQNSRAQLTLDQDTLTSRCIMQPMAFDIIFHANDQVYLFMRIISMIIKIRQPEINPPHNQTSKPTPFS